MAIKICLPKNIAQGFRQALKSGQINPDKLSNMTSKERSEFFKGVVGDEYSTMTNSLFESKLLLKNQKQGLINWAKTVAGLKPDVRSDLLSKVNKLQNALTPENTDDFLNDFVNTKLGVTVTNKEAADIARLAQEATAAKEVMESAPRRGFNDTATPEEIAYGLRTIKLNDYVNDLKTQAERLSIKELLTNPRKAIMETAGVSKSVVSSIDNGALLRQGIKTIFSNPIEYFKNAPKTFSDIKKVLSGKDAQEMLNAEIISDPMYDLMKKAGVAVGSIEEAFPSRQPEMIPVLGKFFKASDAAYSGFLHRMRADLFKKYYLIAEKTGININSKKELEGLGALVNSLTGRGKLPGQAEAASSFLNLMMFSPRNLQSHVDFLTAFRGRDVSNFAKKEMSKALLKTTLGLGTIMATSIALWGKDSVETDFRSSNTGKLKVGNEIYDITGGMATVPVLATRLATVLSNTFLKTDFANVKNAKTGKLKQLNKGNFAEQTGKDVLFDFFENKSSPILTVFLDALEDENFNGENVTVGNSIKTLFGPLTGTSLYERIKGGDMDLVKLSLITALETLGINIRTQK
jgi:hypothetical protein